MRYREFLIETVLNLHTPEQKRKYADVVWDMLQRSYKKIGGFKSASNPEELINDPGYWKLIRRGDRITSVNIYKKSPRTHTYKVIASAAETALDPEKDVYKTTPQGISDYGLIKTGDIKMNRSWAEVSGPAESVMKKYGARPVSNKYAEVLTGKEIIDRNDDGYHYTRLIQGEPHEKIIYGFAKLTDQGKQALLDLGLKLHDLPTNVTTVDKKPK